MDDKLFNSNEKRRECKQKFGSSPELIISAKIVWLQSS